jgi:hypothetical protein
MTMSMIRLEAEQTDCFTLCELLESVDAAFPFVHSSAIQIQNQLVAIFPGSQRHPLLGHSEISNVLILDSHRFESRGQTCLRKPLDSTDRSRSNVDNDRHTVSPEHVCKFIECSSLVSDCKHIRRASSHHFSRITNTSIWDSIATSNRLTSSRSSPSVSNPSKAKRQATSPSNGWRRAIHESNSFDLRQQHYPSRYALAVFSETSPAPLQR